MNQNSFNLGQFREIEQGSVISETSFDPRLMEKNLEELYKIKEDLQIEAKHLREMLVGESLRQENKNKFLESLESIVKKQKGLQSVIEFKQQGTDNFTPGNTWKYEGGHIAKPASPERITSRYSSLLDEDLLREHRKASEVFSTRGRRFGSISANEADILRAIEVELEKRKIPVPIY
jgi:regulator of replication initiation timing